MKLIINTSSLYVGGGIQVALSFINELKQINKNNEYHIFLSQAINKQIEQKSFPKNCHFYLIEKSPSSLKTRKKIVAKLDALEKEINPDIVFSVFAPSYWKPRSKHIIGFAMGWITNPKSEALKVISFKQKTKRTLDTIYKKYYVKRDAQYFIVETDDVKEKLFNVLKIPKENVFVVGNTYSSHFDQADYSRFELTNRKENEFRLITISHNYSHKNIKIIKEVLPYLENKNIAYKFFLTIDEESYKTLFHGHEDQVINLGPVQSKYCPSLYEQCDALFLPTLLESFTASYPEAMKMQKPILTSDLSFAHSLCQKAAIYFDPFDSKDIADKIIKLSKDQQLQEELITKGNDRLQNFETAKSRARKYVEICERIIKKDNY